MGFNMNGLYTESELKVMEEYTVREDETLTQKRKKKADELVERIAQFLFDITKKYERKQSGKGFVWIDDDLEDVLKIQSLLNERHDLGDLIGGSVSNRAIDRFSELLGFPKFQFEHHYFSNRNYIEILQTDKIFIRLVFLHPVRLIYPKEFQELFKN